MNCAGIQEDSASVTTSEVITVRLPDGAWQPRTLSVSDGSSSVVFLQGSPQASKVKIATLSSAGRLSTPTKINTAATMPELLNKERWSMSGRRMITAALLPDSRQVVTAWVTEFKMEFAGWNSPAMGGKKAMQNHPHRARNAAGETVLIWAKGTM